MGSSNPHDCRIWATEHVPTSRCARWAAAAVQGGTTPACLRLCSDRAAQAERMCRERSVVAVVPYWATCLETLVLRAATWAALPLIRRQRTSLAAILKRATRYDNLFQTSFPYSLASTSGPATAGARFHALPRAFLPALCARRDLASSWCFEMYGSRARPYAGDPRRTPARPAAKALLIDYCLSCISKSESPYPVLHPNA